MSSHSYLSCQAYSVLYGALVLSSPHCGNLCESIAVTSAAQHRAHGIVGAFQPAKLSELPPTVAKLSELPYRAASWRTLQLFES
jgi:hypothetical protein